MSERKQRQKENSSPAPVKVKALVIGAGFGGMAAALRARSLGHEVTIVDRCTRLGGRAQVFERGGFRHDAGPTVITAPFLLDQLFELFDRDRAEAIKLIPLDPWYRFVYPDGDHFDYGPTKAATIKEIRRISSVDEKGYRSLVAESKDLYELGFETLADQPFDRFSRMLSQVPAMLRLKAYRSVWQLVCSHLKDDKLRRAFSIQPLLLGGNPFDTTAIYNLIHYLEVAHGIWFAKGGTGAIVDGLGHLMRDVGIIIRLNETVSKINSHDGRATGITLQGGEEIPADYIISNTDPAHLYESLIPSAQQPRALRAKRRMLNLCFLSGRTAAIRMLSTTPSGSESVIGHC